MVKEIELKKKYKTFKIGELIDLAIPNEKAIEKDGWADWFNNINSLQATQHGIFPNYKITQRQILKSLRNDVSKKVFLICEKKTNCAIGLVSLQKINYEKKSAEITINSSSIKKKFVSPLATLEAMALICQFGFENFKLINIYAGQAYPKLLSWNKLLEIIGFKTEAIFKNAFVRGHVAEDIVRISCNHKDYEALKKIRGSLWGSTKLIYSSIKKQPKESFVELLDKKICKLQKKHFKILFD